MAADNNLMSEQSHNIRFVKEVEKHPSLYNFELPEYTRRDMSDAAWKDVGRTMGMTPSACRERWRNLRAVFMRTIRSAPRCSTGKKKPYYLAESMQFLVPFLRPFLSKAKEKQQELEDRERKEKPVEVEVEHIKEEIIDANSDEFSEHDDEEEMEQTVTRKRPGQEEPPYHSIKVAKLALPSPSSSSMPPDSDHMKSFLDSLLPELHEMNSAQFKQFKRRVLLLIDDIVSEIPGTAQRHTKEEFIM